MIGSIIHEMAVMIVPTAKTKQIPKMLNDEYAVVLIFYRGPLLVRVPTSSERTK
jgi:hypothetical protein